jgi:predicted dehydrogenase
MSKNNQRLSQAASAAGAVLAGGLAVARAAHAAGSDRIKIALVGCGGRGTGAAINALAASPSVTLVAMADAFAEPLRTSLQSIETYFQDHKERVDVPEARRFVGLDAFQKALGCGIDMVLLCGPPGFRPGQFEAAVAAGKHVFLEKPVATDGPGVRRILAANRQAKEKGLAVAVGHHLRHEIKHKEIIRRIHDGAIGPVRFLRVYFDSSGVWVRPRKPGQSEMEHQVHNWYYFTWLSGDHIVEQHVHDIDVGNWIKQGHPVKANGMGGRQVRIGPEYGEIYDHHSVEFEYADGARMFSVCRHMPGTWGAFSEHAHGTKGRAEIEGHGHSILIVRGQPPRRWERGPDGHQLEMDDLFAALAAGRPYNEGDAGAEASMTAILGRMATYSGRTVTWDEGINSSLDLAPPHWDWNATPQSKPGPDGIYPCAIPGVTRAW